MRRIIGDIKKHYKYVTYSTVATLKAEVAGSRLNWIWWILEPFCFMLVYAVVFGVIFNASEPNQALFIFVGLSAWQFFSRVIKQSVGILKKNRQVIGKIYMPKYILIIQNICVNGFKMLVCFLISFALMIYYKIGFSFGMLRIIPWFISFIIFVFGFGCFMMHFGLLLKDLGNITDIILRFLTYFVGVYYSIEKRIPAPFNSYLVRWNPIAFFIDCIRRILIYNAPLDWVTFVFWTVISVIIAYAGIQLVYKNENSYVKVI